MLIPISLPRVDLAGVIAIALARALAQEMLKNLMWRMLPQRNARGHLYVLFGPVHALNLIYTEKWVYII